MSKAEKINPGLSLNAPDVSSDQKIFILGFNRCGTRSISAALKNIGIGCAHWDQNRLALAISKDVTQGQKVDLDVCYPQCNAFMDIINVPGHGQVNQAAWIEGSCFAEELIKSYPDAYFILNTRPVNDWINSRLKHKKGDFIEQYRQAIFRRCGQHFSDKEIVHDWRCQWHQCHGEIFRLFSTTPGLKSLVFDITTTPYSSLKTFLSPDYLLEGDALPWVGKANISPAQKTKKTSLKQRIKHAVKKRLSSKS